MRPSASVPVWRCLGLACGQRSCSQRFSRLPFQRTGNIGSTASRTSSLWIASRCWLAILKPPGNGGKDWPRQNSRRVTMWRQCNRRLSLPTSIRFTHMSFWPFKQSRRMRCDETFLKVIRCPSLCCCTTGNLKLASTAFFNSCSVVAQKHLLPECPRLNSALPLIPENYSVTASMESEGGHGSLTMKKAFKYFHQTYGET